MFNISLSKDFKHGHKLWSVWCAILVALVSVLEVSSQLGMSIAPLWREVVSPDVYPAVVASLSTLGVIARFLKQAGLTEKESNDVTPSLLASDHVDK